MNLIKSGQQLPARMEDLAQFVLIGTEQLTAVRAAIRALDKLNVASDVYHQKLQEAQDLGEAVLDAKVKVGELALAAPKATGHQENRGNRYITQEDRESEADFVFSTSGKQEIAKSIGVQWRTIQDWQQLAQHPELVEEAKQQARQSGEIVGSTVALQLIKKQQKQEEIETIKQRIEKEDMVQLPELFNAIVLDPPWNYAEVGQAGSNQYDPEAMRGTTPYPTMSLQQIADIQLPADDDCVLFLWTTHAFLRQAFDLMQHYEFTYKACLVWDKEKMGIGRTVRMQCEFCLIGIKGNPIILGSSERDIIREARREHSRKPDAFYAMVERMVVGRRLDYFSRENRVNWHHYGAEVGKF